MIHKPELRAAAYLAGEMDEVEAERFEQHLLDCEECWAEVDAGRRGLRAVESLRELAPPHLRTAVRRRVRTASTDPHADKRRLVAAAVVVVVVGTAAAGLVASRGPADPAVIRGAVAAHSDDRLPGADMPKMPPPDLSELGMKEMGAGAGRIDEVDVTAFAYRDETGRRLTVYIAADAFPMPPKAQMLGGPDDAWMDHRDGVMILGARHPHRILVVSEDDYLVHDVAVTLDLM